MATSALHFDIPVMIVVALTCPPIFFGNYCISRVKGAVFMAFYATLGFSIWRGYKERALAASSVPVGQ